MQEDLLLNEILVKTFPVLYKHFIYLFCPGREISVVTSRFLNVLLETQFLSMSYMTQYAYKFCLFSELILH